MGVPEHETEAPAEARTGGDGKPKRIILRQFIAFLMFVLVVVPLLVIAVSIIFGFILAEVEGWPVVDGFYYVTSMLCGLPQPLTDVQPEDTRGKILDIIIAIWALAVAGTIIGIVGGMSFIGTFIETAENAFSKNKKKVSLDEERFEAMTSGSETAVLCNKVSALEVSMRELHDVLNEVLAATKRTV